MSDKVKIVFMSWIFGMIIMLVLLMKADYQDAMAKCQVQHSFDTCFHSLNR